jgi:hypothetical protein
LYDISARTESPPLTTEDNARDGVVDLPELVVVSFVLLHLAALFLLSLSLDHGVVDLTISVALLLLSSLLPSSFLTLYRGVSVLTMSRFKELSALGLFKVTVMALPRFSYKTWYTISEQKGGKLIPYCR